MNRRSLRLSCALYFVSRALLFGGLAPERVEELRSKFYQSGGFAFDMRKLSDEEKLFLTKLAREEIPKDPFEGGGTSLDTTANETLVMLGDPETTRRYLARYRKTGLNADPLIRSYDPKVIVVLSADLFQNDPWPIPPHDLSCTPVMPPSYRVCIPIAMILEGSPTFSKEVNEWAVRNFHYDPAKPFHSILDHRTLLRKWWKQNERFFKAGDYQSVKPGDEFFAK